MLRIASQDLPELAQAQLNTHTMQLAKLQDFSSQVDTAKKLWKSKTPANLFQTLKENLSAMCTGSQRCMYCEDSEANEIEHRRPKDIYPLQTFDWENLLYACGGCNSPKGNRFAILNPPFSAGYQDITPKRNNIPTPPSSGLDALIDPRRENPMEWLWLDFDTFRFSPMTDKLDSPDYWKAEYTIKLLHLNERDSLVRGRRSAFKYYRNSLADYLQNKAEKALEFRSSLNDYPHRTVWEEMKRQRQYRNDLRELFLNAEETLAW